MNVSTAVVLDGAPKNPAELEHRILISWAGPPTAVDLPTQESRMQRLIEVAPQWAHSWSTAILNVPEDRFSWIPCHNGIRDPYIEQRRAIPFGVRPGGTDY